MAVDEEELSNILESQPLKNIRLDLAGVDYLDGAGIAVMRNFVRHCTKLRNTVSFSNVPSAARRYLEVNPSASENDGDILSEIEGSDLVSQLGQGMIQLRSNAYDIVSFVGSIVEAFWSGLRRPLPRRWDGLTKLFEKAGVDAVPIVVTLSFLMGAILAFQAAIQLRKFGANIFRGRSGELINLSRNGAFDDRSYHIGTFRRRICRSHRVHASF